MQDLINRNNQMNKEIGQYQVKFTLSPELIKKNITAIENLEWHSIKYGSEEKDSLPEERGIYAFVVGSKNNILPHHGYVMYIGIAGRNSNRTLKDRYKDYLNEKKILKRDHIVRLIATWGEALSFFYATISPDFNSKQLEKLEEEINNALLPPFSKGDLRAEFKSMRGAFA